MARHRGRCLPHLAGHRLRGRRADGRVVATALDLVWAVHVAAALTAAAGLIAWRLMKETVLPATKLVARERHRADQALRQVFLA